MVSLFLREQKRYTFDQLCGLLNCSEGKAVHILKRLREFGIVKMVRTVETQRNMTELFEENMVVCDVNHETDESCYVFTFVGVIVIEGIVLKCYPKYLMKTERPTKELIQILKVLEKYNSKEHNLRMFEEYSEDQPFNHLAVLLSLMYDFYENGAYNTTQDIIESNGPGEILWDKTINETITWISDGRPYYIDLQTKRKVNDEYDYIKRLHECILTRVSNELGEADLLELFQMEEVHLNDEELSDFGDTEYILYRINNELNQQFNTRKQMLLKTMYTYVAESGSLYSEQGISLFGTNNFNLVWEKVCADIMDNQLNMRLGELKLPVPLASKYNKKERLIDLIEKPLWSVTGKTARDTLIPDLISISRSSAGYDFLIFDAKYYNARLEVNFEPFGQPGIESITKQYLYQLSYQGFIKEHKFAKVRNVFLMPTEENEVLDKGEVSMEMLKALGLQNIKVRFIPARMAYEHYLSGSKMNFELLNL